MKDKLTMRQERFAQNIFKGMTQREAWGAAGYSTRYPVKFVDHHACDLANTEKIQGRIEQLTAQLAREYAIMPVGERAQILSEIARARFGEFADEYGNLEIKDKARLMSPAVQEVRTERTLIGIKTSLKLRDPVAAIDLLNKMDRIYSDNPPLAQDNRQYTIIVFDEVTREMTRRILSGERRQECKNGN